METLPLVSICSTTYNLEIFIGEAIESWLNQITNFDFEIVICDDCSKDNTVSIIENYIEKYPNIIRLLTTDVNLGMMPNYIRSLEAAKGKYIAVCDGDDYWIDTNKLQMQIDFLESNPDFVACLTNSYVIDEYTKEQKIAKTQLWDVATSKELLYHDDFHKDNVNLSPGHVSTYVFKNKLIDQFPTWFYDDDVVTDYPLYMIISKFGKTKFFNIATSVYRKRDGSHSFNWYEYLKIQRSRIKMHSCVNEYLDYKYSNQLDSIIAKHYINVFKYFRNRKFYYKAVEALFSAFRYDSSEVTEYLFKNRFYRRTEF